MPVKLTTGGSPEVSLETLEASVKKAHEFVYGLIRTPGAMAPMRASGYTQAISDQGFDLIENVHQRAAEVVRLETPAQANIDYLAAWDQDGLALADGALTGFPEIKKVVLEGLAPTDGVDSVDVVHRLLRRLKALEGTVDGDAALARLAAVGLTPEFRAELEERVRIARGGDSFSGPIVEGNPYIDALLAVRDWYYEWSTIAHAKIKRREHLIRIGLAERREGEDDETTDIPVDDPTPFIDPKKDS